MIVGLDTAVLRGPMTGVANYLLNTVSSIAAIDPSVRFVGFQHLGWRPIDEMTMIKIARARGKWLAGQSEQAQLAPSSGPSRTSALAITANRLARINALRQVNRVVRRLRFQHTAPRQMLDLFHATSTLAPADPGVPVLPIVYDLSNIRFPHAHPAERVRWLERMPEAIAKAPLVQTISEFSRQEIVEVFGYPANKIFIAPPAAGPIFRPLGDEETGRVLRSLGLAVGAYLLAVSTLEPRKNFNTLISAYGRLSSAERVRMPLIIAGGGGWGNLGLPAETERLVREGTVRFVATVTDETLRSLYEGARIMLYPSVYEGFGMPVVEALACGTPVAHSSETSMDEISGELGRKVPKYDVEAWTQVIRDAIAGTEHLDSRAREVNVRRAGLFSWHDSASKILEAYEAVLSITS